MESGEGRKKAKTAAICRCQPVSDSRNISQKKVTTFSPEKHGDTETSRDKITDILREHLKDAFVVQKAAGILQKLRGQSCVMWPAHVEKHIWWSAG